MMSSSGPARKRRRPAYSCIECRRRKVRCDRAMPCGQCTAQKVADLCAYNSNQRAALPIHGKGDTENETLQRDPAKEMTEAARPANQSVSGSTNNNGYFQGTISKTRVFGQGHWMAAVSMGEDLPIPEPIGGLYEKFFQRGSEDSAGEISKAVTRCKQLARDLKTQRPSRRRLPTAVYESFPVRQVMDDLVELYFKMFESCHRIIFQPFFMAEYKKFTERSENADSSFLLLLSLVLAAAGRLHGDPDVRCNIAANAHSWIYITQTWLSGPLEKNRLTIKGIQVYCILLLCRQIYHVGADLVWISAGSLLRMAMHMGLHQDPDRLGETNELQKQIRRRLWWTILEMNVQASLDSGMAPMIHVGDYNTEPPSDIIDRDLLHTGGHKRGEPFDKLPESTTRSSLQPILAKSLPLRLEVARLVNSLQDEPSYDRILMLDRDLTTASSEATTAINQAISTAGDQAARQFTHSYSSHLIRRFSLSLHFRYAIKSRSNPLYSHSQKVCLEASLDLISLLDDTLYGRLLVSGSGMFRDIITRGAMLICMELSPDAEANVSYSTRRRHRDRQAYLLQDARRLLQYAEDRIREGETGVKTYVFLRMMLAHTEAHLKGFVVAEKDVVEALTDGLAKCQQIMKDRLAKANQTNDVDRIDTWMLDEVNAPSRFDSELGCFRAADDFDIDFDVLGDQFSSQWADQNMF